MTTLRSVLILDDDPIGSKVLAARFEALGVETVSCHRHPTTALAEAESNAFDAIAIDVTLNYRGNSFGGLEVYRRLAPRYGDSSILAYSQYLDDHVLERFGEHINFLERGFAHVDWFTELNERLLELRANQRCFVAIPFSEKFEAVSLAISEAVRGAGYIPVRVDEVYFTHSIVDRIFKEISNARFVISALDDRNPNVFFETGFATALNKDVITVARSASELPFDVASKNTIIYNGDLELLSSNLSKFLLGITRRSSGSGSH